MATETLNINGWDAGWVGNVSNVDEPIALADGSTVATSTNNDPVVFDLTNPSAIDSDLDIVTGVDVVVRCRGTFDNEAEPRLQVELLIAGVSKGTHVQTINGVMSNVTFSNVGWDQDWTVAELQGAQVRVTSARTALGSLTWFIDCIDVEVTYTPVDPITREPAEATLALTGKAPDPQLEETSPINKPEKGSLALATYAPLTPWTIAQPAGALGLNSDPFYTIQAREQLQVNGWDSGWPSGFYTNIDEPVAAADGSVISTGFSNGDAVTLDFDPVTVIDDLDTVLNVLPTVRLRIDHTYTGVGGEPEVAPELDVELLINGVSQGTNTITPLSYGVYYNYNLRNAGWNADWSVAQLNSAQIRLTTVGEDAGNIDAFYIDTIDLIVEYEPQPPIIVSIAKGSLALSGQLPLRIFDINRAPAASTVALSGQAPTILVTNSAEPFYATRRLNGKLPSLKLNFRRAPAKLALSLAAKTPARVSNIDYVPGKASFTLAGKTPTIDVTRNVWRTPVRSRLRLITEAPAIQLSNNPVRAPGRVKVTLAGKAPEAVETANALRTPAIYEVNLSGQAVTPVISTVRYPAAYTASLAGYAPIASVDQFIVPAAGSLAMFSAVFEIPGRYQATLAGAAPTALVDTLASPAAASLALSGQQPISEYLSRFVRAEELVMTTYVPTLQFSSLLTPGAPGIIFLTEDRGIKFIATPTDVTEY